MFIPGPQNGTLTAKRKAKCRQCRFIDMQEKCFILSQRGLCCDGQDKYIADPRNHCPKGKW